MSDRETMVSPRLEALRQELEAGNAKALESFWHEIAAQGAPLVEPIEGDDEHSLVTLAWRGKETRSVALISLLTDRSDNQLARLLETDLWYLSCRVRNDVRATYQFDPDDPSLSHGEEAPEHPWARRRADPLNPRTFAFFDEEEDPTGVRLVRSVLEMPAAPAQPWIEAREGVPRGEVEPHRIQSDILGNERRAWVYTPPGYAPDSPEGYPLLVLLDGWGYLKLVPTTTILDNLIAAGRIPPTVAVLLDSVSLETRMQELILYEPFNEALVTEFVPWIRARYRVTSDPGQTAIGGASAGGLAAAYAAFEHPETFGNVLSQSGAFRFMPKGEKEYEWLARQVAEREKRPLTFYLDAGILETRSLRPQGDGPNLIVANRHIRNVLRARGYTVHYAEFAGGHDYISWRGTLSDGLQAVLGTDAV
jgi:enterochelin esterase family protein